jgi:hypothetical protein
MDKRIEKRHKRQVLRARERVRLSEPDVRTPEQIRAAREASRARRNDPHGLYSTPAPAEHAAPADDSTPKGDE